jgi:hypothetical protein
MSEPIPVPLHPHIANQGNPRQAAYTEEIDAAEQPESNIQDAAWETGTHHNDYDPGIVNAPFNYSGMPDITQAELDQRYLQAQEALAMQFEAAHPGFSYTRNLPILDGQISYNKTKVWRSVRTRYWTLNTGDPILLLGRNPRRGGATLWVPSGAVAIADDAAALTGLTTTPGQGSFPLQVGVSYTWNTEAELWATAYNAAIGTLALLEYIDN